MFDKSLPFRIPGIRRLVIGINQRLTGARHLYNRGEAITNDATRSHITAAKNSNRAQPRDTAPEVVDIPMDPADNEEPERRRINKGKHKHGIARKIDRFLYFIQQQREIYFPPPTPQEQAEREERERMKKNELAFKQDTYAAFRIIQRRLTELGFCHKIENGKKVKIDRIWFNLVASTEDGRQLLGRIDHYPWGVRGSDIIRKETVNELTAAVGRPVTGHLWLDGTILKIDRAGSLGLPNNVFFKDMIKRIPGDALPLSFICGEASNGKLIVRSLESLPHLIGAGETGSGKSVFLHSMLCCLISRNKPEELRLGLIDLKFGGVSLKRYEGLPHLINDIPGLPGGIAKDLKESLLLLEYAYAESERRGFEFVRDRHHVQDIEGWNKTHRKNKFPRIVLFIDEIAFLMDKSDASPEEERGINEARRIIKILLRLARSSGVHLCGFTQSFDKNIMSVAFKTNVAGRVCFSVPDAPSSILVIGTGEAVNLAPPGRGYYKRGTDKILVQAPNITEADISTVIRNAKEGKLTITLKTDTITPEEIIQWAIEENNNSLLVTDVINRFRELLGKTAIEKLLKRMELQTFQVGEFKYQVTKGRPGYPRKVIRID